MERKKAEVLVIGVINIQEPSGTYALLLGSLTEIDKFLSL